MSKILNNVINGIEKNWLVTGAAGFIGTNLCDFLLKNNQKVTAIDNFSTGKRSNIEHLECVSKESKSNFYFHEGDIRDADFCNEICSGIDIILHQAALGSVPRSIVDPITTNEVNISGTLNVLWAAHRNQVERVVYAASSSTYGDHKELPKIEDRIGKPLSPYAVTKFVNELYAGVFSESFGLETIGLRYFNVFGPRQDPNGAYAAVIPKWISKILKNEKITVYGDGSTSRDFCYIENVVQANILSALTTDKRAINNVYNIACGRATSLNQLVNILYDNVSKKVTSLERDVEYEEFRSGDVKHSLANIDKAKSLLDYSPSTYFEEGVSKSIDWYIEKLRNA